MTKLDKFRVSVLVGACVFLGGGWVARARAADGTAKPSCTAIDGPKAAIQAKHGRWITVTTDQWEFLRGIYAGSPDTPPGLPPGDRAVLAQPAGEEAGVIFFIEGQLACAPMTASAKFVQLLREVDTDNVVHVGDGM